MSRPRINPDRKRQSVTISIDPKVIQRAKKGDRGMSRAFQTAVECCEALVTVLKGRHTPEDIRRIGVIWESEFEKRIPLNDLIKEMGSL